MKEVFKKFLSHPSIHHYLVICLCCFIWALYLAPYKFLMKSWVLCIPILLAPFFEWWAHKYLLHRITDPLKQPYMYSYMKRLHYRHHWEPNNLATAFAPISSALLTFLVFGIIGLIVFDLQSFLIFEGGVISYFLFYEWIHLAHHVPSYKPLTKFGKNIRNAHSWHHYKNENFWWGVTNSFGDYIMKTFQNPKDVEFSPNAKSLGDLERKQELTNHLRQGFSE